MNEKEQKQFVLSLQIAVLSKADPIDILQQTRETIINGNKELDEKAVIVFTKYYINEQGGER